jgi:hypothetical protein
VLGYSQGSIPRSPDPDGCLRFPGAFNLRAWQFPAARARSNAAGGLRRSDFWLLLSGCHLVQRVSYRQIGETDIPSIATLLVRGFPKRNREFWLRALGQLSRRQPTWGLPKYGYVLESDGQAVGVVLVISSASRTNDMASARCNLSSWYVEPQYRSYAAMFRSGVVANSAVTYLNISAGRHIWPIIEAQGFLRYCDGIFIAVPMLIGLFSSGPPVEVYRASPSPKVDFDPYDQKVLLEHAGYGCISLWCATSDFAYPFVFRWRLIKGVIPCAQMIYCRDIAEFARFAGPIGRFPALRGMPLVLVDANGSIAGLVGKYFGDRMPKYFKGPDRPRLGDISYTESALWGVYGSLRNSLQA